MIIRNPWAFLLLSVSFCELNLMPCCSFPTWNCSWLGSDLLLICVCLILGLILRISYLMLWCCQSLGTCKFIWIACQFMFFPTFLKWWLEIACCWISLAVKQVIHQHGLPCAIGSKNIRFWHSLPRTLHAEGSSCLGAVCPPACWELILLVVVLHTTQRVRGEVGAVSDPCT